MDIGCIFSKVSKNDIHYQSYAFDKAFLELVPQLKECSLTAFYIPEDKRKSKNSPNWRLVLTKKEYKKEEEYNSLVKFDETECPF